MAEKQTWIFLRGLGRQALHWSGFDQQFETYFPNTRVVCLDAPGFGTKNKIQSPLSISSIAKNIQDDLQFIEAPYYFVAQSLGGMVAMELARTQPRRVKGLVLINTSLGNLSSPFKRLKLRSFLKITLGSFPWTLSKKEKAVIECVVNDPIQQIKTLPLWIAYFQKHPSSLHNVFFQLLSAATYTLNKPLSVPCLILASQRDHLVDVRCSIELAQFLSAPIHIHPTAGHDLPNDDALWPIQKIQSWLVNNSKPSSPM